MTTDCMNGIFFPLLFVFLHFLFVILVKITYLVYGTGDAINHELMDQDTVLSN